MGGVTPDDLRGCLWCDAALVQKEGETKDNFNRRKYCDKRHKSLHQGALRHRQKRHVNCSLSAVIV